MKRSIWLSALTVMILVAGGCTKPETAPQPEPVVSVPQEQTIKEQSPATVAAAEKNAAPAAVIPAPPAPVKEATVKVTPVEPTKTAPVVTLKPAPKEAVTPVVVVKPAPKAATAPQSPAKTVTYQTTKGPVTFDHLQHSINNPCSSCHPSAPPVKIILDKEKAHQLCRGCHQENKTGPTQCTGCHKKG